MRVGDRITGEIGRGLLVLVGIGRDDGAGDVKYIAGKIRDLRIFEGEHGKPMDRSIVDVNPRSTTQSVPNSSIHRLVNIESTRRSRPRIRAISAAAVTTDPAMNERLTGSTG